ncbi:hypothetical protein BJ878DRAFT_479890 [Calycina marina]|uniref:BRCT domain-containing protein n=1 Tax=Calycina marina TaxID=1763456 RepID=A0A9P7Z4H8_9HELO|nr:hypothetical protein BJ878DRAFT_479890 [Calycina marina]
MANSWKAAEKTALKGKNEEPDTQQCEAMMNVFLSSSPVHPQSQAEPAAEYHESAEEDGDHQIDETHSGPASHLGFKPKHAPSAPSNLRAELLLSDNDQVQQQTKATVPPQVKGLEPKNGTSKDAQHAEQTDLPQEGFLLHKADSSHAPNMSYKGELNIDGESDSELDDHRSTMSATQANSESVYEHFPLHKSTNSAKDRPTASASKAHQHHSATDSTAKTYGKDDIGHVTFSPFRARDTDKDDDELSQDQSFTPVVVADSTPAKSCDPRTPAPAINPFLQRGSVLKGHEMFGATQPSSIVRNLPSGASSRPSPDVYNGFPSPIKGVFSPQLPSSPLQRRVDASLRTLLRSKSMEEPELPLRISEASQTSDSARFASSFPPNLELRPYVPMQHSQEQRIKEPSPGFEDHISENDDSEPESNMTIERRMKRSSALKKIEREIAEVSMRRADVEVPSTGRKHRERSELESCIAQCSGLDAWGTQSQTQNQSQNQIHDIIADSQKSQKVVELPAFSTEETHTPQSQSERNREVLPETKAFDAGVIPETSPPSSGGTKLLPMGDIAHLSFTESQEIDVPGFTQDLEFEQLMNPFSSQPEEKASRRSPLTNRSVQGACAPERGIGLDFKDHFYIEMPAQTVSAAEPVGSGDPVEAVEPVEAVKSAKSMELQEPPSEKTDEFSSFMGTIDIAARGSRKSKESLVTYQKSAQKPITRTSTPRRSSRAKPKISTAVSASRSSKIGSMSAQSTPLSSVPPSLPGTFSNSPSVNIKNKNSTKRKSTIAQSEPTRASKRKSTAASTRDSSADPLAGPALRKDELPGLFQNMAFAISYVKKSNQKAKTVVTKEISTNGGHILEDGFGLLFEAPNSRTPGLSLSELGLSIGFVALIADEHSRKVKFMEALALGLPCLSPRWIEACVSAGRLLSWAPFLLCAGYSTYLDAVRSRNLKAYPADEGCFVEIFAQREVLLDGRSILLVAGKGSATEAKKPYVFLTRVLGPSKLDQVADYDLAKQKLVEAEARGESYDIVYVDNEKTANSSIYGPGPGGPKKRKSRVSEARTSAPKRVRLMTDEVVIQSLIVNQLLDQ